MVEETKTYLTVLLSDNENLKNWLTSFLNTRIVLQAKYENEKDLGKAISPEEKNQLINAVSMFRAYATRVKISINVLRKNFGEENFKLIEEDYELIKTQSIPDYIVCERFVQNVNDRLGEKLNVAATISDSG